FGAGVGSFGSTDPGGGQLGNSGAGIRITDNTNVIGGVGLAQGNLIVNSGGAAVAVTAGARNLIRGNAIFNNGFGIDLGPTGSTANDVDDADAGANNLQNTPEITGNTSDLNTITITFRVPSA